MVHSVADVITSVETERRLVVEPVHADARVRMRLEVRVQRVALARELRIGPDQLRHLAARRQPREVQARIGPQMGQDVVQRAGI